MFIPKQSFIAWKVIITFLQVFAMLLTLLRLWLRYRGRRLWMDDYTVILAFIIDILNTLAIWFVWVETENNSQLERQKALSWLVSIPWYTLIWFTRISLVLTITRIFPAWGTLRRCARTVALAIAIMYVGIMAWQFTTPCTSSSDSNAPTSILFSDCNSERHSLTIIEFIFDISASLFLVIFPVAVLCTVAITRGQKTLTITFLISNLFVLLSTLLYCSFTYSTAIRGPGREVIISMLSELETIISLIGCNMVALVTFLNRNDFRPGAIDDNIEWKKPKVLDHQDKRPSLTTSFALQSITSNNQASAIPAGWLPQQTLTKSVEIEQVVL